MSYTTAEDYFLFFIHKEMSAVFISTGTRWKGNAIFRKEKKNKIANANVAPVLPDENCLPGAYTKKSFLAVPLSLNFKLLKPC